MRKLFTILMFMLLAVATLSAQSEKYLIKAEKGILQIFEEDTKKLTQGYELIAPTVFIFDHDNDKVEMIIGENEKEQLRLSLFIEKITFSTTTEDGSYIMYSLTVISNPQERFIVILKDNSVEILGRVDENHLQSIRFKIISKKELNKQIDKPLIKS